MIVPMGFSCRPPDHAVVMKVPAIVPVDKLGSVAPRLHLASLEEPDVHRIRSFAPVDELVADERTSRILRDPVLRELVFGDMHARVVDDRLQDVDLARYGRQLSGRRRARNNPSGYERHSARGKGFSHVKHRSLTVLVAIFCAGCGSHTATWIQPNGDAGGTRDSRGSSINASNVKELKAIWRFRFPIASRESGVATAAPIVSGGMVYIEDLQSDVFALRASDGAVGLAAPVPAPGTQARTGLSFDGGSIYGSTDDDRVPRSMRGPAGPVGDTGSLARRIASSMSHRWPHMASSTRRRPATDLARVVRSTHSTSERAPRAGASTRSAGHGRTPVWRVAAELGRRRRWPTARSTSAPQTRCRGAARRRCRTAAPSPALRCTRIRCWRSVHATARSGGSTR